MGDSVKKTVGISENNKGIRIQFTVNGTKYKCQPISKGKWDNPTDRTQAEMIAKRIELDLICGTFDFEDVKLTGYCVRPDTGNGNSKTLTLKDIWDRYKADNCDRVQLTTQQHLWSTVDRALSKLELPYLEPKNATSLVNALTKVGYSQGTIQRLLTDINAATNHAVRLELIAHNPYKNLKGQLKIKQNKQRKQGYNPKEVEIILEAFKSNKYQSKLSRYDNNFYYPFVKFRYLTGCRPEDAIALTWGDIRGDKISFNKAYSKGILKSTKNDQIRLFPVNKQLKELLESIKPEKYKNSDRVFPSPLGGYICLTNFSSRYWKRVVEGLVNDGSLDRYLPFYNLRHSFASLMLKQGVDLSTLAALLETSIEMLSQHYLIADTDVDLPEI